MGARVGAEHHKAGSVLARFGRRVFNSPVLMTWSASAARSLNLLVVLPLIVTRLEAPEIAVWYLFVTLIQLQLLADLGFSPTFVRVFAYAAGGGRSVHL